MGITQYSRIQHRRGTITDLQSMAGPLNTSELGHIIDQRRLFIGNGQISEGALQVGNTEIITDATLLSNPRALQYSYQGNIGIVPQTGVNANTPTVRSIGQILDDYVSIKEFGAQGDGQTDDTAAWNRAMQQLYCSPNIPYANPSSAYRKLFCPAGKYIVNGYAYVPPNAHIEGELGTIIEQDSSAPNSLIKTVDNQFQSGAQMGMNGAQLPTNIIFRNITLQMRQTNGSVSAIDNTIVRLERATNVLFDNVRFVGGWSNNPSSLSAAVYLDSLGTSSVIDNIRFAFCYMDATFYGIDVSSNAPNAHHIYFDFGTFENMNNGVFTVGSCSDIKVSNSKFKNVSSTAISASALSNGVNSINNTFDTCGALNAPVIWFQNNVADFATNCTSISDTFINCTGTNVQDDGTNTIVLSTGANSFVMQNISILPLQAPITLPNTSSGAGPQATSFTINLNDNDTAFIDYTLTRGSTVRIGRLSVVCKGANVSQTVVTDLFSENSPSGIIFDFSLSGTILTIVYTDTLNSGVNSSWNTQTKFWQS